MSRTIGWISKMEFNGISVGVAGGSLEDKGDTHDVTDTQSNSDATNRPVRERAGGIGEIEINATMFSKTEINPHAAPINIRRNQVIPIIQCWLNGYTGLPYTLLNVLIDDVKSEGWDPNQPNKVSFHGYCGNYAYPGEV